MGKVQKAAKTRMSKEARKRQLLQIMNRKFSKAKTQADFTIEAIAAEAGVSSVLVYRLIGPEFKERRGTLPGPRRSPSTILGELRRENKKLREEKRLLKSNSRAPTVSNELKEAILLLEEQDEIIKSKDERIAMLEEKLKEKEVAVVFELPKQKKG